MSEQQQDNVQAPLMTMRVGIGLQDDTPGAEMELRWHVGELARLVAALEGDPEHLADTMIHVGVSSARSIAMCVAEKLHHVGLCTEQQVDDICIAILGAAADPSAAVQCRAQPAPPDHPHDTD